MSIHREIMQEARQLLHDNMGRLVSYAPPEGLNAAPTHDVNVRYLSAVEDLQLDDTGNERWRSVTINVPIGTDAGQLEDVHLGGKFLLDVDGPDRTDPWTVHSFPNTDVTAGFVRCLVVQRIKQSLAVGLAKPRK